MKTFVRGVVVTLALLLSQAGCTSAPATRAVATSPTEVVYSDRGPIWSGEGSEVGFPSRLNKSGEWSTPITLGSQELRNVSKYPLTLLSVKPVDVTGGLDVVGIRALRFEVGDEQVSVDDEFPIAQYDAGKQVRGTVLRPYDTTGDQVDLYLGLRTNTRFSRYEALRITYKLRGKTYAVTVPLAFQFCRGDPCE